MDLCYQCKLCYNHCPYTPPHRWQVFPPPHAARALGGGAGAGRHPAGPLPRQYRAGGAAGQPDRPALNWMNESPRTGRDAVGGRHPQGPELPRFHRETFSKWFDQRRRPTVPAPLAAPANLKVALFATCSVEYNDPGTGKAMVACWRRTAWTCPCPRSVAAACRTSMGVRSRRRRPSSRTMPRASRRRCGKGARSWCRVPPAPYMLKQEYPWLDGSEDANLVAAHTRDLFEYLSGSSRAGAPWTRASRGRRGRIAYELALPSSRAQNMGHALRRRAACSTGAEGGDGGALFRGGRDLGHEERVLPALP